MCLLKHFKTASLRCVPQAGITLLSSIASTSAPSIINEGVLFLKVSLSQYVKSVLELYYCVMKFNAFELETQIRWML